MVLVDTSVWISYFRQRDEILEMELDDLLRAREVATTGLILAELRQGCKSRAEVELLLGAMRPLAYLEAHRAVWLRAGELVASGAARGHKLDVGDCLVAAIALSEDAPVFTLDRDFERIPGLRLHRPRIV